MNDSYQFIEDALECSVYVAPRDHGLTLAEIHEAAKQAGYRPGEINDALASPLIRLSGARYLPPAGFGLQRGLTAQFNFDFKPDFRNFEAFEFVRTELAELAREVGRAQAALPRDTLVERGALKGHERQAIEIAIAVHLLEGFFYEKDGSIGIANDKANSPLPSAQRAEGRRPQIDRPHLARLHDIVRDVVLRRNDGRPAASDPLDAFEATLSSLGHARFRTWWVQKRHELRIADQGTQPTTVLILAASLGEAALAFV